MLGRFLFQEYSQNFICDINTVESGVTCWAGTDPASLFSAFSSPETHNLPKQPPLAQAMGQAAQCLALMARTGSGSCAFASVDDYLH